MTDKELLELAAKAAGIEIVWNVMIDSHNPVIAPKTQQERNWLGHEHESWNPLTDDGDAMRLAVKLKLMVSIENDQVCVEYDDVIEEHNGDPYAATRRAIVRTAAEIGKQIGGRK